MVRIYELSDRSVMSIRGSDARKLLQGIITNNIEHLETTSAIFSALLTPQGKFLYDFILAKHGDELLLETETRQMGGLLSKLTMYRLRADVQFSLLRDYRVYASDESIPPLEQIICHYTDPRLAALGTRYITSSPLTENTENVTAYETHRLQHGIPEGWKDAVADKTLLLELGYDHLHAIDFHKGCYIGQEVTARSKYRANLRKAVYKVRGTAFLPPAGTVITYQDKEIGEMRSGHECQGLAMMRIEDVNSIISDNKTVPIGDNILTFSIPVWQANSSQDIISETIIPS